MPPARDPKTGRFVSAGTAGGGQGLGVASGKVVIDTSQLQSQRGIVVTAARQMGTAIQQSFVGSTSAVKTFGRQLQSESARIQKMRGELLALGAAGGAFAGIGIKAAEGLRATEIRLKAITGDEKEAVQIMGQLEKAATRFSLPVGQTQAAITSLIPSLEDGTQNLDRWVGLIARLSTLNPGEGIEGATFAIREALSSGGTDLVSLAERFNISKKDLRAAVEETGNFADGLDLVLNKMGATQGAAEAMGKSVTGAARRATDAFQRAAGVALEPYLNTLADIIGQGANFLNGLRQTNPELLHLAGGLSLAAAGGSTLILTFGQIISSLNTIRNASPATVKALGAVLAGGAGLGIGLTVSRGLANAGVRSGDLGRVAAGEDPGAILAERLKQGAVIIAAGFLSLSKELANGVIRVRFGFEITSRAFDLGVALLKSQFAVFLQAFAAIARRLGLNPVADQLSEFANTLRPKTEAVVKQVIALQTIPQRMNAEFERINQNYADAVLAVKDTLFPAADAVEEGTDELVASFDSGAAKLRDAFSQIGDLLREFNEESARISERRGIDSSREMFDFELRRTRELAEFERGRAQTELDFYRQRERDAQDFYDSLAADTTEAERQAARANRDFAIEERRRAEDHAKRILEITNRMNTDVEEAAASLDAAAVFKAQRSGRQALDAENTDFSTETQRRREDFTLQMADLRANLDAQRAAKIAAFQQQQADELAQFELQRARQLEEFQFRQALEDQDRALRLQRLQEDQALEDRYRREALNKQLAALSQELNFRQLAQQAILNSTRGFLTSWSGVITGTLSALARAFGGSGAGNFTGAALTAGRALLGFASGGRPPLNMPVRINERGLESGLMSNGRLALFSQPTQIFSAPQTQALMAGTGAGAGPVNVYLTVDNETALNEAKMLRIAKQVFTEVNKE